MSFLYSMAELMAAGPVQGPFFEGVTSISIDSREIEPGALFVAIKGDRFDGHDFVDTAFEAGATAALVSTEQARRFEGRSLISVADPLEGLAELARHARMRSTARIVAVTGSAGKTTTKEAIRLVCEAAGKTHASIRSFNNHWGVPLMLARMPQDTEYAVFEIGMNHAGEIETLSRLVQPHVAVVTTVAAAHLEFFDSVEDIARAKAEIFAGAEPGGTAVLGADHGYLSVLRAAADKRSLPVTSFGFDAGADARIENFTSDGGKGSFALALHGHEFAVTIAAPGRHMAANAAAALCVAEGLGHDPIQAAKALRDFGAPAGRGAVSQLGDPENPLILIDESYNANPASMAAALEVFGARSRGKGRKVLVLGDMLELGVASERLHAALKTIVLAADADLIFLCGGKMGALAEALGRDRMTLHAADAEALNQTVPDQLANGDTVMVKGSNGVGLSSLVAQIRSRFSASDAVK
jgi:UDP-N-acetylmuramoyl-tripeptide--D-alanyl-D-alanine ligase